MGAKEGMPLSLDQSQMAQEEALEPLSLVQEEALDPCVWRDLNMKFDLIWFFFAIYNQTRANLDLEAKHAAKCRRTCRHGSTSQLV